MKESIPDFFGDPGKYFHQVIAVHDLPEANWEELSQRIPLLPRGWFELSRLPVVDRIEFSHEYWLSKLPFVEGISRHLEKKLADFFEKIEEIGVFAVQEKKQSLFDVHMVYSLKEAEGFFQGNPPVSEETLEALVKRFGHVHFPPDYLAFLQIHDGFSKYSDTGMIKTRDMARIYQKLQQLLAEQVLLRRDGQVIDPGSLIPFYESFGLHCYQCFYTDWYPDEEMGNVYFSSQDHTISNYFDRQHLEENLAFPSFLGWLIYYLEALDTDIL